MFAGSRAKASGYLALLVFHARPDCGSLFPYLDFKKVVPTPHWRQLFYFHQGRLSVFSARASGEPVMYSILKYSAIIYVHAHLLLAWMNPSVGLLVADHHLIS